MDGDTIEIPSSQSSSFLYTHRLVLTPSTEFQCILLYKAHREKMHIFEPTPPTEIAHKVSSLIFPVYIPLMGDKAIGKYSVTSHCLGSGSFATVHLAFDQVNHRQVACKAIKTKREHEVNKVHREVGILTGLDHVSRLR